MQTSRGKIGTRSTKGCWTCRLRRKKCDETHPSCLLCTQLHLACSGYGPRPSWMDKGENERREAEKVKTAIAARRQKRRADDSNDGSPGQLDQSPVSRNHSVSSNVDFPGLMETRTPASTENLPTSLTQAHQEPLQQATASATSSQDLDWLKGNEACLLHEDMAGMLDTSGQTLLSPATTSNAQGDTDGWGFPLIGSTLASNNSIDSHRQADDMSMIMMPYSGVRNTRPFPSVTIPNPLSPVETTQADSFSGSDCQPWLSSTNSTYSITTPSSGFSEPGDSYYATRRRSLNENLILSHYLEHAISQHSTFRKGQVGRNKQWMQFLLLSSDSIMDLALILGETLQCPDADSNNPAQSKDYDEKISRARSVLRKLPSPTATMSLIDEEKRTLQLLVACTSLLQTVQLELHYCGTSWQSCLKRAAPYIQSLIDLTVNNFNGQWSAATSSFDTPQIQNEAARDILCHFVWFDIIACLTTGEDSYMGINHHYLLRQKQIDMAEIFGCENEVAMALCDIHALQNWKRKAEASGKLSTVEMVTRGTVILSTLNQSITRWDDETQRQLQRGLDSNQSHKLLSLHDEWNRVARIEITLVYARAAIVYLHIVLSGPNPQLEEIKCEVAELLKLLESLCAKDMIRYVSWPLCVAACFMEKAQYQKLAHLLDSESTRSMNGSRWKQVLCIAEECHRLADEGRHGTWVAAMENLQKNILLA